MNWQILNPDGQPVVFNAAAAATVYAPTNAPYVTVVADANLSNEFALSSLGAGLLYNNPGSNPSIATLAQSRQLLDIVCDRQAVNTSGGGSAAAAWQTRVLNTWLYNDGVISNIASNQFTLPAGLYHIVASAPAFKTGQHKIRLYDVTNARVARAPSGQNIVGTAEEAAAADTIQTRSMLDHVVSCAAPTTFRIEHYTATAQATNGLGLPTNATEVEIYTLMTVYRMQ